MKPKLHRQKLQNPEEPDLSCEYRLLDHNSIGKQSYIGSIDEVGRGSLFGPVTIGMFLWSRETLAKLSSISYSNAIKDSKQLSQVKREKLYLQLTEDFDYVISSVSSGFIDKYNISAAIQYAIHRAIKKAAAMGKKPAALLIDGNNRFQSTITRSDHFDSRFRNIRLDLPVSTEVGGDRKCKTIAAASILAKVYRDRIVKSIAPRFPGYDLEKNAGYGTRKHREQIQLQGATRFHRNSFLGKILK